MDVVVAILVGSAIGGSVAKLQPHDIHSEMDDYIEKQFVQIGNQAKLKPSNEQQTFIETEKRKLIDHIAKTLENKKT
jgi:hypothetical protein